MSNNIQDTNVDSIRSQIQLLQQDIQELRASSDDISDWEKTLQRRYRALSQTSMTLFTYIFTKYATHTWNQQFFDKTINIMLQEITRIQTAEVSQEDASASVGSHLAKTYIPQLRK